MKWQGLIAIKSLLESLVGMGFEHWEVGFRKKMGWEMGLVPPPPSGPSLHGHAFSFRSTGL